MFSLGIFWEGLPVGKENGASIFPHANLSPLPVSRLYTALGPVGPKLIFLTWQLPAWRPVDGGPWNPLRNLGFVLRLWEAMKTSVKVCVSMRVRARACMRMLACAHMQSCVLRLRVSLDAENEDFLRVFSN